MWLDDVQPCGLLLARCGTADLCAAENPGPALSPERRMPRRHLRARRRVWLVLRFVSLSDQRPLRGRHLAWGLTRTWTGNPWASGLALGIGKPSGALQAAMATRGDQTGGAI